MTGPSCCLLLCLQQAVTPHLPGAAFHSLPRIQNLTPLKSPDHAASASFIYEKILESAVSPLGPLYLPGFLHPIQSCSVVFFPAPTISLRGYQGQRSFLRIWTQKVQMYSSSDGLCNLKPSLLPWLGLNFPERVRGITPSCLPQGTTADLKEKVFMVTHSSVCQNVKDRK